MYVTLYLNGSVYCKDLGTTISPFEISRYRIQYEGYELLSIRLSI